MDRAGFNRYVNINSNSYSRKTHMKILIFGAKGQLGTEFMAQLADYLTSPKRKRGVKRE